ncbi:MAG: cyclic pyranopterin monophosphate synthase MoaC [Armatimonadetes bacterium CG07_land_8_20_14_0_80_40_9]|nr:MAG: cyclic pyranopterin monophosphate synthase MoaC [Armatimonadetes bacterium CG07_land_8_20_14_0_80_40_9]
MQSSKFKVQSSKFKISKPVPDRFRNLKLTHLDSQGRAKMVDVTPKKESKRVAVARGSVLMRAETLNLIEDKALAKGDLFNVARIAGILAAKKVDSLIPLSHPLLLTNAEVNLKINKRRGCIDIESCITCVGKTGVEMEALTSVAVAALTIYDMCKAVDKEMVIEGVYLVEKKKNCRGSIY